MTHQCKNKWCPAQGNQVKHLVNPPWISHLCEGSLPFSRPHEQSLRHCHTMWFMLHSHIGKICCWHTDQKKNYFNRMVWQTHRIVAMQPQTVTQYHSPSKYIHPQKCFWHQHHLQPHWFPPCGDGQLSQHDLDSRHKVRLFQIIARIVGRIHQQIPEQIHGNYHGTPRPK